MLWDPTNSKTKLLKAEPRTEDEVHLFSIGGIIWLDKPT